MIVKLLTEHHLEFLSLKAGCRGSSSLHLSKFQIVGNLMPQLITVLDKNCFHQNVDIFSSPETKAQCELL